MKSLIVKRSVVIDGHKTSVSIEDAFWESLKKIAAFRHLTLSALLAAIDSERPSSNLSSSIRLFVLNFYSDQLESRTSEQLAGPFIWPPFARIGRLGGVRQRSGRPGGLRCDPHEQGLET